MATKSEMKVEMAAVTGKMDSLNTKVDSLNTQMKGFIETVSAQMSAFNANIDLRLEKFENRFLFRMLFAVSSLLRICYTAF